MRWSVTAVAATLLAVTAEAASSPFGVHNDALADWVTPPLIPLMEDAGTPDLFPMGDCFGFKLEEATIDEIQKAMGDGKLTSVQLVMCCMVRAYQTEQYIK